MPNRKKTLRSTPAVAIAIPVNRDLTPASIPSPDEGLTVRPEITTAAVVHSQFDQASHLDRHDERSNFQLSLGEVYWNHTRSFNAQMYSGHYEKVRLWFTVGDQQPMVSLLMGGKGRVSIRKLEVYEIQTPPPRPGLAP